MVADWWRSPLQRARRAARAGRWADAATAYRRHLRRDPAAAGIWVQLGHSLKEQGDLGEAVAAYREAVRLAPAVEDGWIHLAHLERRLGDREAAIAALERAIAGGSVAGIDALVAMGARERLPAAIQRRIEAEEGAYALSRYAAWRGMPAAIDPAVTRPGDDGAAANGSIGDGLRAAPPSTGPAADDVSRPIQDRPGAGTSLAEAPSGHVPADLLAVIDGRGAAPGWIALTRATLGDVRCLIVADDPPAGEAVADHQRADHAAGPLPEAAGPDDGNDAGAAEADAGSAPGVATSAACIGETIAPARQLLLVAAGTRLLPGAVALLAAAIADTGAEAAYGDHDHWAVEDGDVAYRDPCFQPMFDPLWFARAAVRPPCLLVTEAAAAPHATWAALFAHRLALPVAYAHVPRLIASRPADAAAAPAMPLPVRTMATGPMPATGSLPKAGTATGKVPTIGTEARLAAPAMTAAGAILSLKPAIGPIAGDGPLPAMLTRPVVGSGLAVGAVPHMAAGGWPVAGPIPDLTAGLGPALTAASASDDSIAPSAIPQAIPGMIPGTIQVIVQTRDAPEMLAACIATLRATADRPELLDIVIMDNRSILPATAALLAGWAADGTARTIAHDEPFNWARANNLAAALGDAPYLLFLNNDVEMTSAGWDTALREGLALDGVGAMGALLLYPDGLIQHAGVVFGMGEGGAVHEGVGQHPVAGPADRWRHPRLVAAVTGAWLAVTRPLFERVGGYEERLPVAYNDVDFCLRVRAAGQGVMQAAHIVAVHRESATRGSVMSTAEHARDQADWAWMRERWGAALDIDPAYNPHWLRHGQPFDGFATPSDEAAARWTMASAREWPWSVAIVVPGTGE